MDVDHDRFGDHARTLCALALARLPGMIDPSTGLMVYRQRGSGFVSEGTSLRYTAIAAIGVEQAEACGLASAIDLRRLHDAMDGTLAGSDNVGDVALVLWAAARCSRGLAERALGELREFADATRTRRSAVVHTTELCWVAIALAEALANGIGNEREVRGRLDRAFRRLLTHRGPSGLLGFSRPFHGAPHRFDPQTRVHARLAFFDAQAYAIVAALHRDAVVGDAEALDAAATIASQLVAHQHALGQWGWRYDTRTGGLVDLYPVYSVHQDGMAPMALLPLGAKAMTAAVARGLEWVWGKNELGVPLAIEASATIWRSIRRRAPYRLAGYALKASSLLDVGRTWDLGARLADPSMLEVDWEVRPYHLGWCLYALADVAAAARLAEPVDSRPRPTLRVGTGTDS